MCQKGGGQCMLSLPATAGHSAEVYPASSTEPGPNSATLYVHR